jgi:hypothetical protein
LISSEASTASLNPLGPEPVHSVLLPQAVSILNNVREEQNDLDAATAAAVDLSAFAYTASTEIDANDYDHVLGPYQVISVAGPGGYLGGNYLINRVLHVINANGYTQSLTLKRNARSSGYAAGGGLLDGIF